MKKNENTTQKTYAAPEIICETDLETKAGSPLGNPDTGLSLPGLDGSSE